MRRSAPVAFALLACSLGSAAREQPPCTLESLKIPVASAPISFTPQQEMDLGDAIAEHVQRSLNVIDDERSDYLQQIGDRILKQLAPTGLTFRFRLVDQPYWNAFAMPGGRIYVTRKLVAFARSEDELAGVVAHEIGHVVARHTVADLSATFRKDLGITTFGDRQDIFEKYRQLVERGTSSRTSARHEQQQQYEADLAAIVAGVRAGYSPTAYIEIWDRYTEIEGKTGNFFSDLFGATRPESRRLREMLRTMAAVPAECAVRRDASAAFSAWQASVVENRRTATLASTHEPLRETVLTPALRGDLTNLKFSPDGRWALAQDDSSLYALSLNPLAVQFRADIDDSRPAQFTADSAMVLVHTRALRVEWWDLARRARARAFELVGRQPCIDTALSPDGRLLGCIDRRFGILLLDVETGETLFKKERAYSIDYRKLRAIAAESDLDEFRVDLDVFQLAFSPDGRFFIVGNATGEVIVDVAARAEAKLPGAIRRAFRQRFTFLGPDRVVSVDAAVAEKSAIVHYPSGEPIGRVTLGGKISAATKGDFVMIRPLLQWPLGLVDLTANKVVVASKSAAFDAFERQHLSERPNGEVGLYELGAHHPVGVATLPKASFGRLSVFDVSSDLRWLAVSGRDRGAVWNLETGQRASHVRAFSGAYLSEDGGLYADFPKRTDFKDNKPVESARKLVRLDIATNTTRDITMLADGGLRQSGPYITVLTPASKDQPDQDVTLEIRDARTNTPRWSRHFPTDLPVGIFVDRTADRVALEWSVSSPPARQAVKDDPRLRTLRESMGVKGGDAFVEVFDAPTGTLRGRMLISTGKDESKIRNITSAGDSIVVTDRHNQVIVYSLATSARRGSVFGSAAVPSESAGLLCVQNESDAVDLYDLQTLAHRARIRLSAGVRLMRFNADGSRLLLLSADQVARVFDTGPLRKFTTAR